MCVTTTYFDILIGMQEQIEHTTEREIAASIANDLAKALTPFDLLRANLVVEGGVGTGTLMRQTVAQLFPQAVYVPTDLAADRFSGEQTVTAANISAIESGQVLFADCYDYPLIAQLKRQQADSLLAVLVSINALYALLNTRANPWNKKSTRNIHTIAGVLTDSPYAAQLHLATTDLWDEAWRDRRRAASFLQMETTAKNLGLATHRINTVHADGLLILH